MKWIDDIRIDLIDEIRDANGVTMLIQMKMVKHRSAISYSGRKQAKCWEETKLEESEEEIGTREEEEKKETQADNAVKTVPDIVLDTLVKAGLAEFYEGKRKVRMLHGLRSAFQEWDDKNIPRPSTKYIVPRIMKEDNTPYTPQSVDAARKVMKPM